VAVARHFAGVEEVVEHAELQREPVQVRRHRRPVHRQPRIPVADEPAILDQIAEI